MLLQQLQLTNFRSFTRADFSFGQTTLIVGPNGCGKTNILEAIYLLSRGKSFRGATSAEIVRFGEEIARVKGKMTNRTDKTVEVVLTGGVIAGQKVAKKRLLVNGVGKRLRDFSGQLKAVLFRPEDLDLILGSPSLRRDYLDDVLGLLDKDYQQAREVYEKALRQRNRLLEAIGAGRAEITQLFYWNQLLVKNGKVIGEKRGEFINWLNRIGPIGSIGQIGFKVEYLENKINLERLEKYQAREVAAGMTLVGPQRDDMIIYKIYNNYNNYNLALYGSRGEQRWAVLWLKLAELAYVEERSREKPILLLDDIFSELDKEHRKLVKSIIDRQQTIVTSTEVDNETKRNLTRNQAKLIELVGHGFV